MYVLRSDGVHCQESAASDFVLLFSLEMSPFPSIFVLLPFSLRMESTITVVRFPLPDGAFPPCKHGLNFIFGIIRLLSCENSIYQSNQ